MFWFASYTDLERLENQLSGQREMNPLHWICPSVYVAQCSCCRTRAHAANSYSLSAQVENSKYDTSCSKQSSHSDINTTVTHTHTQTLTHNVCLANRTFCVRSAEQTWKSLNSSVWLQAGVTTVQSQCENIDLEKKKKKKKLVGELEIKFTLWAVRHACCLQETSVFTQIGLNIWLF